MLEAREAELAAARDRFEEAARDFATREELHLEIVETTLPLPSLRVPVSTAPEGGLVRVLPALQYRKEEMRGTPMDRMAWITIASSPAELRGVYAYWVSWPDGPLARGRINVRDETPIVLRPEPGTTGP